MSLITPRDLNLFRELVRYGLLSTSQLSKRIFPEVQSSTVLRRLRLLEKGGWIYRVKALESGELVWLLSRKGEHELGYETPMIKPNRNNVAHDVQLTDLRMTLEGIGLGQNFIPEWTLRRRTFDPNRNPNRERNVPDGLFTATHWKKKVYTVALELELNPKNITRYYRIFAKYMDQWSLNLVWYFVKTHAFGDALCEKWKQTERRRGMPSSSLFAYTLIDEFQTEGRLAHMNFEDGKAGELRNFFILPAENLPAQGSAQRVGTLNEEDADREYLKNAG